MEATITAWRAWRSLLVCWGTPPPPPPAAGREDARTFTPHHPPAAALWTQLALVMALLGCMVQDGGRGGTRQVDGHWRGVAAAAAMPSAVNLTQLRWVLPAGLRTASG